MVKYLFAKDLSGNLIKIDQVAAGNRRKETFRCLGCNMEMNPVLGTKRDHHFRHKGDTCSYESYLHKLGKAYFKYVFDNCGTFEIGYSAMNKCANEECPFRDYECNQETKSVHMFDLKKYYNCCEIESEYKGFIADLKLSNNEKNIPPIFIEIAVTHKCSLEKINSGIRIIEINLSSESMLKMPIMETIREKWNYNTLRKDKKEIVSFFNFKDYVTINKNLSKFVLFKDERGFVRSRISKIGECDKYQKNIDEHSLFDVDFVENDASKEPYINEIMGVAIAYKYGWKSCFLCARYNRCIKIYNWTLGMDLDFKDSFILGHNCGFFRLDARYEMGHNIQYVVNKNSRDDKFT